MIASIVSALGGWCCALPWITVGLLCLVGGPFIFAAYRNQPQDKEVAGFGVVAFVVGLVMLVAFLIVYLLNR